MRAPALEAAVAPPEPDDAAGGGSDPPEPLPPLVIEDIIDEPADPIALPTLVAAMTIWPVARIA